MDNCIVFDLKVFVKTGQYATFTVDDFLDQLIFGEYDFKIIGRGVNNEVYVKMEEREVILNEMDRVRP